MNEWMNEWMEMGSHIFSAWMTIKEVTLQVQTGALVRPYFTILNMLISSVRYNHAFTRVWWHNFCCHSGFLFGFLFLSFRGLTKPQAHLCLQSSTFAAWKALHNNVHVNVTPIKKKKKKNGTKTPAMMPEGVCVWGHDLHDVIGLVLLKRFHFTLESYNLRHWQYREDNCASSSIMGFGG